MVWIYYNFFIHSPMDRYLDCVQLCATVWIRLLWTFMCKSLCALIHLLGKNPEVELLGHRSNVCLGLQNTASSKMDTALFFNYFWWLHNSGIGALSNMSFFYTVGQLIYIVFNTIFLKQIENAVMNAFVQLIFICCWNISAVGIFIWDNRGRVSVLSSHFTLQKSGVIYTASKFWEIYCF